jgi:UDP-N-acetylmuramoylalanine--D-glutamate ligase
MVEILLLGIGKSNNALNQFMIKYSIEHDYLSLIDVVRFDYKLVIKGPGIYYDEEVIQKFIEKGVDIITDIEFIYWFLNKEYIAITGTNGKTTTTYLITDIINTAYSAVSCGNCGFPISQAALDYKLYKYFVLELSSFQLKGIKKFTPKIAVVTNLKQAHLDYHHTIEDYYKSKLNIAKNQSKQDYLVLNADDLNVMSLFKNSEATKITFSLTNRSSNAYFYKSSFYFNKERVCHIKYLKSKTDIIKYNVLAAICVAKILKIENKNIKKALKNFTFIKYRLEEIKPNIYNDAKSTNVYSTISAIKCFKNKNIILICGGYDRKEEINIIEEDLFNVVRIYVYGQVKDKLYNYLKRKKEVYIFDTLKEATLKALNDRLDEVVLYSPMFASYDQYSSYEERGLEFSRIVFDYFGKK